MDKKLFQKFQSLMYNESGVNLADTKILMVATRLDKRLRAIGIKTYDEYYDLVVRDRDELDQMINIITTHKTEFFREIGHYTYLEKHILPDLLSRKAGVEMWSSACSTGEEPYSMAMVTDYYIKQNSLNKSFSILATDIATHVLETAVVATYPEKETYYIEDRYSKRYLLNGINAKKGQRRVACEIREKIKFERMNLMSEIYSVPKMDVIFCCNVLIYFSREDQDKVVSKLIERLNNNGYILFGFSESIVGRFDDQLEFMTSSIYRKK